MIKIVVLYLFIFMINWVLPIHIHDKIMFSLFMRIQNSHYSSYALVTLHLCDPSMSVHIRKTKDKTQIARMQTAHTSL